MYENTNGTARVRRPLNAMAVLAGALILLAAAAAYGTQGSGVERTELAKGTTAGAVQIETSAPTEVPTRIVKLAPGGTTGWHSHPGPELATVQSGTLIYHDGSDPNCKAMKLSPGQTLVIPGGQVHLATNAGPGPLEIYVTAFVPVGSPPLNDEAKPAGCP
jgi:quercetin dioxygenase-like cupin family protein